MQFPQGVKNMHHRKEKLAQFQFKLPTPIINYLKKRKKKNKQTVSEEEDMNSPSLNRHKVLNIEERLTILPVPD